LWYFNNTYLPSNSKSINNKLLIENITIKNSGVYKCRVENMAHIVHEDNSTLIVQRKFTLKLHNFLNNNSYVSLLSCLNTE